MTEPHGGATHPQRGSGRRMPPLLAFTLGVLIGAAAFTVGPEYSAKIFDRSASPTMINSVQQLAGLLDAAGSTCSFLREPTDVRSLGVAETVVCADGKVEHHLAIHLSRRDLYDGLELMASGLACMTSSLSSDESPVIVHDERWSVITTSRATSDALIRITGASVTVPTCRTALPMMEEASGPLNVG